MRVFPRNIGGIAWRATLTYAVVAGVWILVSDTVVEIAFREPAAMMLVSRYKGLAFVALSSLALLWVLSGLVKQVQESQRRADVDRRRLTAVLDSIPEGVALVDREGAVVFANAKAASAFGLPLEGVAGHRLRDIRATELDGAPIEGAHPVERVLNDGVPTYGRLLRVGGADHSRAVIEMDVLPLTGEEDIEGAVVLVSDASERMEREERDGYLAKAHAFAIACEREFLRGDRVEAVMGGMCAAAVSEWDAPLAATWLVDTDAMCLRLVAACGPREPGALPVAIPMEGGGTFSNPIAQVAAEGRTYVSVDAAGDSRLSVLNEAFPDLRLAGTAIVAVEGEDRPAAVVVLTSRARASFTREVVEVLEGVARDASHALGRMRTEGIRAAAEEGLLEAQARLEESAAARAREADSVRAELDRTRASMSEFVANMGHELRAPLTSIIGLSGVLLRGLAGELNDEQRSQLAMVERSGRALLSLLEALLDIARIDAGHVEIETSEFDLAELIREIECSVRPSAEAKGLVFEVAGPERVTVTTDRGKLSSALRYLLENAVSCANAGSVRLRAQVGAREAMFEVSDTGESIPAEDLAVVFDETRRAVRMRAGRAQRASLGVAVASKFARMLGGGLEVRSAPGEGTRFTLRVPTMYDDDGDAAG